MKRDPGDILDRFSIATLKMERVGSALTQLEFELFKEGYMELLAEWHNDAEYIQDMYRRLYSVNGQIWDLESAVRRGQLDNDVMEVGHRAIDIRKINANRITLVNEVNQHFGEGVENVKQYHISEPATGENGRDQA